MKRLEFDVAWPDYGAIPTSFAGGKIHRFPSWVVLEDVTRGRNLDPADVSPFRERLMKQPPKWVIAADSIESIPVWQEYSKQFTLEIDYGNRFESLPQLDRHWYGSKIYPRYLYRRR